MTRERRNKYEGDYKDGKKHGKGTCIYYNRDWYKGDWKDDKRHGIGTAIFCNCSNDHTVCSNGTRYEGEWKDDKANGIGTVTFVDGGKYIGEFKNGSRHGKGVNYDKSGSIYDGEYVNAKRQGYGIHTHTYGSYEGYWKDGVRHGKGIQVHDGVKYDGEFKDGKRHGKGIMTMRNGVKYEVEYNNGKKIKEKLSIMSSKWNMEETNADLSKAEIHYQNLSNDKRKEFQLKMKPINLYKQLEKVTHNIKLGSWSKPSIIKKWNGDMMNWDRHIRWRHMQYCLFIHGMDGIKASNSKEKGYYEEYKSDLMESGGVYIQRAGKLMGWQIEDELLESQMKFKDRNLENPTEQVLWRKDFMIAVLLENIGLGNQRLRDLQIKFKII